MILPCNVADYAKEPQANGPVAKPARVLLGGTREGIWNLEYFEAMALRFCVVARKRGQQAGRLTGNLQHCTARLRFLHSDAIAQAGTSYEGD